MNQHDSIPHNLTRRQRLPKEGKGTEKENSRVRSVLCSLFIILCSLFSVFSLSAQESPRSLTLDETLNILYPSSSTAQKEFRWDPFLQEGSFIIEGHYGAFSTAYSAGQNGFLMVDNRDIYSISLPYQANGELVFPESFVATAKEAFALSIKQDSSNYRIAAIIIDPGHGGKDSGATRYQTINGKSVNVVEKDINLTSARKLRDMLAKAYPDKRILMTRESDITMSLEERTAIANSVPIRKNEAIIYISIHSNASPKDKNAKGFEVWHLKHDYRRDLLNDSHFPDSPELRKIMNLLTEEAFITESIRIAESILDSLKTTMGKSMPSRGLLEEDWFVVRRSHMPAVLVELGFVTNKDDAAILTSETGLQKLTDALYKGIVEFVGDFERSGGFIASR